MNQVVNFFWTILCFIPVFCFWLTADLTVCYIFIGISALSLLLPAKLLQLSNTPKFYQSLGIKLIRKLVQNGEYVNKLIRKFNPTHKTISGRAGAIKYLKAVKMYERYHFLCFTFFLLTAVYAVMQGRFVLFSLLIIANIVYNICPVLLQQYNRARISKLASN